MKKIFIWNDRSFIVMTKKCSAESRNFSTDGLQVLPIDTCDWMGNGNGITLF